MTFRIETLPDSGWADRVTEEFVASDAVRISLATGNTVAPVYERLVDLDGKSVFLLDEFGDLGPDDPARCAAMLHRQLIEHATGRFDVFGPDVDAPNPAIAADDYAALVDDLDLAILGLGRNGHIGMNEPGSNLTSATRVVELSRDTSDGAVAYGARTRPTWGITVGIAEIMNTPEVWLLVNGVHKRTILDRTLNGPIGSEVPATFLRQHHNCTVFADASATGQGASDR